MRDAAHLRGVSGRLLPACVVRTVCCCAASRGCLHESPIEDAVEAGGVASSECRARAAQLVYPVELFGVSLRAVLARAVVQDV